MAKSYKIGKYEATPAVLAQVAVAALLAIGALVLGYVAFGKWRFKANLAAAFESYDTGQYSQAKQGLLGALEWKPDHAPARELLAKILCEGEDLDGAEREYKKLQAQGHDEPSVRAGLGVVYLKKADRATSTADAGNFVKQAQDHFKSASSIPEGDIGLGHCELLIARRYNEPRRVAGARSIFQRVRDRLKSGGEYAASMTLGGAMDYYMGLGVTLAAEEKPEAEASVALTSAFQYNRRWVAPLVARMMVETRRLRAIGSPGPVLDKEKQAALDTLEFVRPLWGGRDTLAGLKEAWVGLRLAVARAAALQRDMDQYSKLMGDAFNVSPPGFQDAWISDAALKCEIAMNDELEKAPQSAAVLQAIASLESLERRIKGDSAAKELAPTIQNNLAWMHAWRGLQDANAGNSAKYYKQAADGLREALKAAPEDYILNRNLLLVLKRTKPAPPQAEFAPLLEKAKAGATGEFAKDFEQLQKVLNPE